VKGIVEEIDASKYSAALAEVLDQLTESGFELSAIAAVGHRVVHGGALFSKPTLVNAEVIAGIKSLVPLAPLHNPANLLGIEALAELLPDTPQVAVFDTAFHTSIPDFASTYAIPREVTAEFGIRRYGFHGTSHQYVTKQTAKFLGQSVEETNIIICHIGNGGSVTAVRNGKSVDTSMGLTPLEGLVMGTRSGDIDPGVLFHLARVAEYSIADLDKLLNRESGMLGLSGMSDMREVWAAVAAGDASAKAAIEIYNYRIQKYVSAYLGVVPNVQAVVFTAGVGENDEGVRAGALKPLAHLGIELDSELNHARSRQDRVISTPTSKIKVLVIATNEELEIAEQTAALL
ncbi:MAG: hypothetical protein RL038_493, partial [Actinomycetota bacterium]